MLQKSCDHCRASNADIRRTTESITTALAATEQNNTDDFMMNILVAKDTKAVSASLILTQLTYIETCNQS